MAETASPQEKTPRRINKVALGIGVGMVAVMAAAVFFTFHFVEQERQRALLEWQVRLGIVADSRAADVNEWVDANFAVIRELSENASLQIYMDELAASAGNKEGVTDEAAQAGYLRNLLVATSERSGFKPPKEAAEVNANVERAGVAGLGLVDADGRPIVSSAGMPPISGKIRTAVANALNGEPALIDVFLGASNLPTIGFALPVYGIQSDQGAQGIGAVVGIRTIDNELYDRLKQPGEESKTAETYLVRKTGATVEYLSPLADGTLPLKRSFAMETPNLASVYAIQQPGGFTIGMDYAGEEVLVTSRPLADLPWVLVRKINRAEALSGTETRLKTILIVFVLIIIGVTVAIIAVWRHGSSIRAQEAAEKSRIAAERFENMTKFMNLVTNSQPTQIFAVTGDTKYTFANEPAARHAGISADDLRGKTMASIMGPVKGGFYGKINEAILDSFSHSDDTEKERQSHIHTFGEDDELEVLKTDHIPLRGDRDYPPGILMVMDDITEYTMERRKSDMMMRQLINALISVVERRDPYTTHQSAHISEVARAIAREMEVSDDEVKTVDIAGSLINLGRIFIPNDVLAKTGALSEAEQALFDNCFKDSVELLKDVEFQGPVVDTISQTGEFWDGSGPQGLKEEEILHPARILNVAAAFIRLVNPRSNETPVSFDVAVAQLMQQNGSRFDRRPVSALINYLDNRGGAEKWADFGKKT
ncbi:MAG: PAS domain-containing protein [Rhodospirillaceae bacterium]|nr:PAS domain-containing protein [Rhodospirillaceae bacterium]MBL6931000.1 PAS domain-containing protein [Rhodospirillales bacterium]